MQKREAISKKIRFEVFKRDKFTCQYCGKEAPNVVLEIDHIKPISSGGSNKITNLLTSCFDCNRGKGKIKLSDDSAVVKAKKGADELQERRNQLTMMREWIEEAESVEEEIWNLITKYYFRRSGEEKTSYRAGKFKIDLIKLTQKLGVNSVFEAIDYVLDISSTYCAPQDRKNVAFWDKVYKKVLYSNIPADKARESTYKYCMGIYKNKFRYFKSGEAELLKSCVMPSSISDDEIKNIFKSLTTRVFNMTQEELTEFTNSLRIKENGE